MIASLLSGLFNLILNLLVTVLQVVLLPVNALFSSVPALSEVAGYVGGIKQFFDSLINSLAWPFSIVPQSVKDALFFVLTVEIATFVIFKSTKLTAKLWKLLQKIKFW